MYVRSGYFIQRDSCKPSRERMCPGAMPGGVRGARWAQIDAIARANVPCRPLERRLPCQMICRNGEHRCTGGLAPIIEVRISGPPGSGTLRRNLPEWVNDNPCSMMDSVILGVKSERTLRAQGLWGGLAPIIEVRISGPPGSGTLRGVDTVIWRLSGR